MLSGGRAHLACQPADDLCEIVDVQIPNPCHDPYDIRSTGKLNSLAFYPVPGPGSSTVPLRPRGCLEIGPEGVAELALAMRDLGQVGDPIAEDHSGAVRLAEKVARQRMNSDACP